MKPLQNDRPATDRQDAIRRRLFLERAGMGFGALALGSLLDTESNAESQSVDGLISHFAPKAKRVIYLFQSGGPSQLDLFDHKPLLNERNGEDLPASVRMGQRLTAMSGNQATLPLAGSIFNFSRHGQSGAWISDQMPHTARIVDDLCFVKSMRTEAINHDPAITFLQTGSQIAGRPSIGSWLSYGLGTVNQDLPAFCVLISQNRSGQPLYSRLWGSGFLPSEHQGVKFLPGDNPVVALKNPSGMSREGRREALDFIQKMHRLEYERLADPEILTRMTQYELAYRMQMSVPDALSHDDEPASVLDMYGPDARKPGTYAANCVLARRLAERGVRFIQLYHQGWDQHGSLPDGLKRQSLDTDQPSAALIQDLKSRGLLDDTLVIWGGEFGRTNYSQGKLTATNYGRDHHPRCFTVWMAGGGIRPGVSYGATDEFGYNITENPVEVHDLHATLLHLMGIDHERLTYRYQGRRFRLTDVFGHIVDPILA